MARSTASVRLFALEEAQATLPLVRVIAEDLARLAREVRERRQRLEWLNVGRGEVSVVVAGVDPYREELCQMVEEVEKDERRLEEFAGELRQLGIELWDPVRGRVAFPAWANGRLGYYCWEPGDSDVSRWEGGEERPVSGWSVYKEENAL